MASRLRKWMRISLFAIVATISLIIFVSNARLYAPVPDSSSTKEIAAEVLPQLEFIGHSLRQGAGHDMQKLFPEGYFFSYELYGLTWAGLARDGNDPAIRMRATSEAHWALSRIESQEGRAPFNASLRPRYGIFYAGWTTWLRGEILCMASPEERNSADVSQFRSACGEIADALDASPTPFLEGYAHQSWPCDSVVAVAALALHDRLFPPLYGGTIKRWLAESHKRLVGGFFPHRVDYLTGSALEPPRGSSQSIIQRFLPEIDPDFAREQYAAFRSQFVGHVLGAPGVREYAAGTSAAGDVDSGPLIFGISASASVVTIGAARIHGDEELARPLTQLSEGLGMPLALSGRKRYALGCLPIGDEFLAWSKTARSSTELPLSGAYSQVAGQGWRMGLHALSLGVIWVLLTPWWGRRLRAMLHRRRAEFVKFPLF